MRLDGVVMPRVELTVRSNTGSTGHGPSRVVRKPDRRSFSGNFEAAPLMRASSRTDLNINNNKNDETRNSENIEDGDFPALKSKYDQRKHTHHKYCCNNRNQNEAVFPVNGS